MGSHGTEGIVGYGEEDGIGGIASLPGGEQQRPVLRAPVPPGHGDAEVIESVREVPSESAAADDVGPLHAAFGCRRFSVRRR